MSEIRSQYQKKELPYCKELGELIAHYRKLIFLERRLQFHRKFQPIFYVHMRSIENGLLRHCYYYKYYDDYFTINTPIFEILTYDKFFLKTDEKK